MAINTNHTVEDLNEVKCAVVEKNVTKERAEFLKNILAFNNFVVVVAVSAPPKAAKTIAAKTDAPVDETTSPAVSTEPLTYTVGVTNVSFNSVNAIFGRQLKTRDGHLVSLAYWNQEEVVSNDVIPYYEKAV